MKEMKTKKMKRIVSAFLSCVMVFGLAYVPVTAAYTPTITATPSEGETVSLLGGRLYKFASTYNAEARGTAEDYCDKSDMYAPRPVTIQWEGTEEAQYCTVKIGKKADLSDAERYVLYTNKLELDNLSAATHYYYQIDAEYADKTVKSRIFEFETAALPRTVWVEGVSNTRDIGGYYSTDGQYQIKQGLVWRGAKLTEITEAGKKALLEDFGVKTVLAINGEAIDASILQDDSLNYVTVSAPYYEYDGAAPGINSADYKDALLTELRVFADEANYPVYFHCSLGRDRTGTLATLLQALCGVGEDDLYLDYELSWFSTMGWLDDNGPAGMVTGPFTKLINYLKNYGAGTLAENTAQFMLDIGMTQQEIDSIRSILLEEVTTPVTNRTATTPPPEEEITPGQDTSSDETVSGDVPNFSLNAGENGSVQETWTEGTHEVVNYAVTGNPFYQKAPEFPNGLTDVTFTDFGLKDTPGLGNTNKFAESSVVGKLFSGYMTFHGTGGGFFMYGGQQAWQGLRFEYQKTKLVFLYVTSEGIGVDSSVMTIDAKTAGVGDTFKDEKFLFQITVETVNGTDAKVGFWFDGVLYNDSYITLAGAAEEMGGNLFTEPNGTDMTLDVESYARSESLPDNLAETTFSDYNVEKQEGLNWIHSTCGTTVVDTLFSGYMTFHGTGGGFFMYGGHAPWQGLRFQYQETKLVFLYVTSEGIGVDSSVMTIDAKTAGVGDTFKDEKFLFQITVETVNGTDAKVGFWFDGVLYNDSYITLEGAASDLGNLMWLTQEGSTMTVDVESYNTPQSELPIYRSLNEGEAQTYLDFSGCVDGGMVQENTGVFLIIVDENVQVIQMHFDEAAVENLHVGDRIVLKEGLPVQYTSKETDISRLQEDYVFEIASITSDGHVRLKTTASTEPPQYEFAATVTAASSGPGIAYGSTEVKKLTAGEITTLGLPDGYSGDVYQVLGNSTNFGALLDFTDKNIKVDLVKSITFRVYVSGSPAQASYPELRIPIPDNTGDWCMRYGIASQTGAWVDVTLGSDGTNFFSSSRSMADFATADGYLGQLNLAIRANDARVFCIDSVTVTLKDENEFAATVTAASSGSAIAYGSTEVKKLTAGEITTLGLPDGYSGDVYQVLGNSTNFGALLDFTAREIPIPLVEEITFRVYVSGSPAQASYPELRIPIPGNTGDWCMRYGIAAQTGAWVDVTLGSDGTNFFSTSRSMADFATADGYLGQLNLAVRANDARVFCIDSVKVTLKDNEGVAPVIDCDTTEIVRNAGTTFTEFTAYDEREQRQVAAQHDWNTSPFDGEEKLVEGEYQLTLTAKDYYGNTSTKTVTVHVIEPDEEKPVIDCDATTVYAVTGTTAVLDMPITDNSQWEPEVAFTWSQGAVNAQGQLADGTHTLTVTATDVSGNTQTKNISYVVSATEHTQATVIDEQALCNAPTETLPTGLTGTTFRDFDVDNGTGLTLINRTAESDVVGKLFSGYLTFHGTGQGFFMYGGHAPWQGLRFQYKETELVFLYVKSDGTGVDSSVMTIDAKTAGVGDTFKDEKFLFQISVETVNGTDAKVGFWFNGVLYDNEYITLAGAASDLGNGLFISAEQTDMTFDVESYGEEAAKPAEELPTHLRDTTFSDYGILNGKNIGVEKAYTTGSVVGNLFSSYVELYGTELMFNYGGSQGTWYGMRFTWDGTNLNLNPAAGEFTGSYTFTSDVAEVDLSENKFLLQISMEAVDSDQDGDRDDVKLGMWFDGKLYDNEYIYLTDAAAKFGNKLNIVPAGSDSINNYMIIESIPKFPKNNITITPSEFGISDNRNVNAAIYGELKDNVTNEKLSLLGKTLSMDLSYTDAYIVISGADSTSWAGLQLVMTADTIVLANHIAGTGGGSATIDADTAGVDFTKPFNLQLTFERVNGNDLKVGAWFEEKLYNSQYFIFTNTADALKSSMYLLPTNATELHVTAPERTVPTTADGYEVKSLNDYGFENGTYTGSSISKEIADLVTDKLVVSGMVEITGDGSLVLVGQDNHYRLSLGQDAETGVYYLLVDSTDGSIVTPMQIPIGDGTSNRFAFQFVQTKLDVDLDGSADDIELQVWIDGVLSRSYYLSNYAEQLENATYASICPGTGSVSLLTSLDVEGAVGKYYNLADGDYLVLVYTENAADSTDSYEVGEIITTPGDYKVIYTSGGTTITNMIHLWKTGDVHPDGKFNSADFVALKKLQEGQTISKAGEAGADISGIGDIAQGILFAKDVLLEKKTITVSESNNVSYSRDENGNAVMPISGFYGSKLSDEDFDGIENNFIQDQYYQMIAEAGINLINYIENDSATNSDTLAQNIRNLSLAEKYGIGIYIMDSAVTDSMSQTELAEHLNQYGKYSSFAGILITDEPVTDDYNPNNATTQKHVSEIGALSTNLNQYVNINGYTNLLGDRQDEGEFAAYVQEYVTQCAPKVLSFDYYPFERNVTWSTSGNWWNFGTAAIDKGHARYFESLAVMREKSLENDIPFWSFIQAGDNFTQNKQSTENDTPTKSQFMWNVNTSLAYGAKGIEYFPMIQPYYFAYESATKLDYERNGLIGANGQPTKWYDFAKNANTWIQTVDEILMESTSTGMVAVGSTMRTQTGLATSANGVTVSGGHSNYGALVGIFDYNGKTAYYVVNGNYSTTSDTSTATNAITLTFDTAKTGVIYQQDKATTTEVNGKTANVTLPLGGAALVIVD